MGVSTQQRRLSPEARRSQIVDAARTLFAGRPYGTVTTADVADAAGVARSLVHHYFEGIRGVFLAAALDVVGANRETWLAVTLGGQGSDPEIRSISDFVTERSVERALEVNS